MYKTLVFSVRPDFSPPAFLEESGYADEVLHDARSYELHITLRSGSEEEAVIQETARNMHLVLLREESA